MLDTEFAFWCWALAAMIFIVAVLYNHYANR